MTRDELVKLAHQSGGALENYAGVWHVEFSESSLLKFADALKAAGAVTERGECASIADQYSAPMVAGAIRKRTTT